MPLVAPLHPRCRVAVGVNHVIPAADDGDLRVVFQEAYLFFQPVRRVDVIGMENRAELGAGQ